MAAYGILYLFGTIKCLAFIVIFYSIKNCSVYFCLLVWNNRTCLSRKILFSRKYRSSHPEMIRRTDVPKILAKFTGKELPQYLFNKVTGLQSAPLSKKRLRHRFFHVSFATFLRASFSQNTSGTMFETTNICDSLQSYGASKYVKLILADIFFDCTYG